MTLTCDTHAYRTGLAQMSRGPKFRPLVGMLSVETLGQVSQFGRTRS